MNRILDNKPLVWSVIGGLFVAGVAFAFEPIRNLLGIVPLTPQQWFVVSLIALSLLLTVELAKFITNRLEI